MKILVIPELTNRSELNALFSKTELSIAKMNPTLSVASLVSWSVFAPGAKEATALDELTRGYFALSKSPVFKAFDVYIGFLLKEDFHIVDLIFFTSPAAKEIYDMRMGLNSLPIGTQIVLKKGDDIGSEIYRRTVINNLHA